MKLKFPQKKMFFASEWQYFNVSSLSSLIQQKMMPSLWSDTPFVFCTAVVQPPLSSVLGTWSWNVAAARTLERASVHNAGVHFLSALLSFHHLCKKSWMTLSPSSLSSLSSSGPQHWCLEEFWQCYSTFLTTDELCYGPKDSLWFSCFPDIQNDTKAQSVHSHKHIKSLSLLFSTALVAG